MGRGALRAGKAWPKQGDTVYKIMIDGDELAYSITPWGFDIGDSKNNCFKTRRDATKAVKKIKQILRPKRTK